MGWWGYGILDGDTPLDRLCDWEDRTGCVDLYPLEKIGGTKRKKLVKYISENKDKLFEMMAREVVKYDDYGNQYVKVQVDGAVWMASGVEMPECIKKICIRAAESDKLSECSRKPDERERHMANYIQLIEKYNGTHPVFVDSVGLLEQIAKGIC